jgi:hypothetical protein
MVDCICGATGALLVLVSVTAIEVVVVTEALLPSVVELLANSM